MDYVNALMENSEISAILEANIGIVNETNQVIASFPTVLKEFVANHPSEFLDENLDQTYKNIRVFSEIASNQFIHEVTSVYGALLNNNTESIQENRQDYL